MKIAIDISPLTTGHSGRGIGTYTRLLVESLTTYHPEHEYLLTSQKSSENPDIVHYPYFDFFFLTLPIRKIAPTIVTIHDAIPLVFPQAYPPGIRGKLKFQIQKVSLSSVCHIVTDSFCSATDIISTLHQPPSKVTTVYLAADPRYEPASKALRENVKETYSLSKPFLLFVGDINYNKNLEGLFRSFAQITEDVDLVIVSKALQRDNPAAFSLWQQIDQLGIESRLKVLSIPSDDITSMQGIYSLAEWYIQPSLYEGFGLPVLEAQACGCPVISSIGGSLSEIGADSVIEFNPIQDEELVNALCMGITMTHEERNGYIHRGFINLKRFNWEKTSDDMVTLYEKLH